MGAWSLPGPPLARAGSRAMGRQRATTPIMARLLLTHPYHLALDPREAALGRPYPPLNTLNVAAVLKARGHGVQVHDVMFEPDEASFAGVLARAEVDAVAIVADDHAVSVKQCLARVRQATFTMARMAAEAGVPVLVSGPDVSDHPELFREHGATVALVGDPWEAVADWADQLDGHGPEAISGLHGPGGAGGRRANVRDLDALPDPAWELIDLAPYRDLWRSRHGVWELNVWTARGCPYRCNWCAKPVWGRSYQVRSPARVAGEISRLRQRYQPDRIWFTDDIFGLRPAWLRAFREVLDAPVPYRCLNRADLVKEPAYVDDLAATGCDTVWLGAESGSDSVLAAMDKDESTAEIRRGTELLRAAGVRVCYFLQLGYPGETLADVEATVAMVASLKPDEIGVSVSYPLPKTAFYERVQDSLKDTHWQGSMDNRTLFEAPYEEGFYAVAKEVLRSTHSASHASAAVRAFVSQPGRRTARLRPGPVRDRAGRLLARSAPA